MGKIVEVSELRAYLGVGEEQDAEIGRLRAFAIESISRATATLWADKDNVETFNEAVRAQVWMSYYAVRDEAKNTPFLREHLTGLICSLQLCGRDEI